MYPFILFLHSFGRWLVVISLIGAVHLVDEHTYFRYIHITLMFIAVIAITIGSAKAKLLISHHHT